MKLFTTILFLFSTQLLIAQSYSGPESVEYDYANHRWLIANTQSHEVIARDSNGTLTVFVSGLTSGPYGIEIVGDTLFCCSGGSIKGFLLSDASQVFNINLGATFLNGITHDFNGNLYVTDYSSKTIFKVNISAQTDTMIASGLIQSPNGIIFDEYNNRCVFVNWGSNAPIKAITLDSFIVSTITPTTLGSCDGIARDGQGNYYVSNWSNQSVVRYDSSFLSPPVTVASSLHNPADIFYNVVDDTLAIPNAGNNTVDFIGFGTTSISDPLTVLFIYESVYPNPAMNLLNIQFIQTGYTKISVYDMKGKLCIEKDIDPNFDTASLNISELSSGSYVISIINKNNSRFIKEFIKR